MAIQSTLLGNTTIAISPDLTQDAAITAMLFCNLNTVVEYIDVHVVVDGATPTDTNKIVNQAPIDPNDTFVFSTERLVLGVHDRIHAKTTTSNGCSVTVSYVTI
jgi:hypothetical protein